jgi:hypothetical protein
LISFFCSSVLLSYKQDNMSLLCAWGIFLFIVVVELRLLFHDYLSIILLFIFLMYIYSFTISIDLGTRSIKEFNPQSV